MQLPDQKLPFKQVKILEENEEPSTLSKVSTDLSSSILKGQIQGKVANILSAGKRPTDEELGEIAQLQSESQSYPQSQSEKLFQERGLKGLFKIEVVDFLSSE